MERKINRRKQGFECDQSTWDEAGKILKEIGVSRGLYIEVILRALIDNNKNKSMNEIMDGIYKPLFKQAASVRKRREKKQNTAK